MDKYVRVTFVIVGLLVWISLAGLFATVLGWISPNLDRPLIGAQFSVSDLLGLASGVGVAAFLWFNEKVNHLGIEVANELSNVTWPSWAETRMSTIVVVITTVVISLLLGLFDAVWGAVTKALYGL